MSTRVSFAHLERLTDSHALFEHADGTAPRVEHGYCTDDNARLLVVASRERDLGAAGRLGRRAFQVVLDAQVADGRVHNRMDRTGRWVDAPSLEDCWGRALWGLGAAAAHHDDGEVRRRALVAFERSAVRRSPWTRSMAFAALGAADVLLAAPSHGASRALLLDTLTLIGPLPAGRWRWPEPRLRYANAAVAEAVLAAGAALQRPTDVDRGLEMLGWLLALETSRGHLSVTGAGGRGPDERGPQFDQQPIEVAALADACWRAYTLTGDPAWSDGVSAAASWFTGANDGGLVMFDQQSGGGYDGLHDGRVNANQGAESTLAFVSTMQRARAFASAR